MRTCFCISNASIVILSLLVDTRYKIPDNGYNIIDTVTDTLYKFRYRLLCIFIQIPYRFLHTFLYRLLKT